MKTVKLIFGIALIAIFLTACNKEVLEPDSGQTNTSTQNGTNTSNSTGASTITYTTLVASEDTILIGGTTQITSTATGDGLSYNWSTTNGDIIGSGSQITYGASGCCGGSNMVTCSVKDANNNEESKSITILVQ